LFRLHIEIGNKWKMVASHFEGRSDNTVKNNFFSLIRKSLRNACKIIGNVGNTDMVNKIKPKVLSEYIVSSLEIDFSDFNKEHPEELDPPENTTIKLNDFIQKFAFNKFAVIYSKINKRDKFVVRKCLDKLIELNVKYEDLFLNNKNRYNYNNLKSSKKSINKDSENACDLNNNRITVTVNDKESIEIDNFFLENPQETNIKSKSIEELFLEFKKLLSQEENIRSIFKNDLVKLKQNLIFQFEKIKTVSEIILERFWMASEEELKNFSENIEKQKKYDPRLMIKKPSKETINASDQLNMNYSNPGFSKLRESKMLNNSIANFSEFNSLIMDGSYQEFEKAEKLSNFNKLFSRNNTMKRDDPIFGLSSNIDPLLDSKKSDLLKSKIPTFYEFQNK
jgi:hypothetical protein